MEDLLEHLRTRLIPAVKAVEEDSPILANTNGQRARMLHHRKRKNRYEHGETIAEWPDLREKRRFDQLRWAGFRKRELSQNPTFEELSLRPM